MKVIEIVMVVIGVVLVKVIEIVMVAVIEIVIVVIGVVLVEVIEIVMVAIVEIVVVVIEKVVQLHSPRKVVMVAFVPLGMVVTSPGI